MPNEKKYQGANRIKEQTVSRSKQYQGASTSSPSGKDEQKSARSEDEAASPSDAVGSIEARLGTKRNTGAQRQAVRGSTCSSSRTRSGRACGHTRSGGRRTSKEDVQGEGVNETGGSDNEGDRRAGREGDETRRSSTRHRRHRRPGWTRSPARPRRCSGRMQYPRWTWGRPHAG